MVLVGGPGQVVEAFSTFAKDSVNGRRSWNRDALENRVQELLQRTVGRALPLRVYSRVNCIPVFRKLKRKFTSGPTVPLCSRKCCELVRTSREIPRAGKARLYDCSCIDPVEQLLPGIFCAKTVPCSRNSTLNGTRAARAHFSNRIGVDPRYSLSFSLFLSPISKNGIASR